MHIAKMSVVYRVNLPDCLRQYHRTWVAVLLGKFQLSASLEKQVVGTVEDVFFIFQLLSLPQKLHCFHLNLWSALKHSSSLSWQQSCLYSCSSSCHADGSLYRRFIQAEALLESAQDWVILAVKICMNAQPLSPGIKKTLKYISPGVKCAIREVKCRFTTQLLWRSSCSLTPYFKELIPIS